MDVIVLKDGSKFTMSSFKDLIDLIRIYIGDDAVSWLSTYIYDSKCSAEEFYIDQEDEVESTKDHYKCILQDIHDLTGELSKEISEKKLNRGKISNLVGKIAILAYRNY